MVKLLNPIALLILFEVIYIVSVYINLNIDKILIIQILNICFLFLFNIYISHIIFLKKLGNYIFKIINIILIWTIYLKYFKYLYYLIRDLLVSFLNIVIIVFNIIFSKLDSIFNVEISINIFYFYIVKDIIYFI